MNLNSSDPLIFHLIVYKCGRLVKKKTSRKLMTFRNFIILTMFTMYLLSITLYNDVEQLAVSLYPLWVLYANAKTSGIV